MNVEKVIKIAIKESINEHYNFASLTTTLYHGTTDKAYEEIKKSGFMKHSNFYIIIKNLLEKYKIDINKIPKEDIEKWKSFRKNDPYIYLTKNFETAKTFAYTAYSYQSGELQGLIVNDLKNLFKDIDFRPEKLSPVVLELRLPNEYITNVWGGKQLEQNKKNQEGPSIFYGLKDIPTKYIIKVDNV